MEEEQRHVFVSYSRQDYDIVKRLIADLRSENVDVYIDKVGLKPGTPDWEQALRDAINVAQALLLIASSASRKSPYVRDELAIAKAKRKAIYPVWVAGDEWIDSIPMGLGHTQFVDVRGEAYSTGLRQLVDALHGKPVTLGETGHFEAVKRLPPIDPNIPPRNPYKGLQPFRIADRGDFFGRSALVQELVGHLNTANGEPRFLAVIGPSGSGKSSVVMAGLLPALHDGALDDSDHWTYLEPMTPGTHPLENLAIRLAQALPHRAQHTVLEDLRDPTTRGLHRLGGEAVTQTGGHLVLYVDQFEELFTLTQQESERQQFIDLVTTAACEPGGPVWVILTIRADFYDRPMQKYAELGALMETHGKAVLPMTLADLYEVVQEPANMPDVRLAFDDGLVTELVFAVRDEIGGLPLLQFTLDQLFQHRADRCLTRAAYEKIGGVRGALAQHAETTFAALPSDDHRGMARALFLRLIDPGATEQDTTRRRATLTELDLPDAEKTRLMHDVSEAFTHARLLVTAKSGDETTIEVAHEALIREWARLGEWLRESRADVDLQQAISADVGEWIRRGRRPDDDLLYRGTVLDDAQAWARRNPASVEELTFIEVSAKAEAKRKAEQARIARQVQNFRRAAVTFGVVFLLALVAAIYAADQTQDARHKQEEAETVLDDAQSQAMHFALVQDRVSTLAAGGALLPASASTQSPTELYATHTQIAELNRWTPTIADAYEAWFRDARGVVDRKVVTAEMVYVPAGCFWMGNVFFPDERPVHEVCFTQGFWIDRFEVTNAQYETCVNEEVCDSDRVALRGSSESDESNQPVASISWEQAQCFCEWRGARLPTEAEWEYAARGPDSLAYPWGNEISEYMGDLDRVWWVSRTVSHMGLLGEGEPTSAAEVGADKRSEGKSWVGAYDMSGNVQEWVDGCRPYPADRQIDPVPEGSGCTFLVVRGGMWFSESLRADHRSFIPSYSQVGDSSLAYVGFRCARPE